MKITIQGKSLMVHIAVWLSYLFLLVLFFSESRDIDLSLYRSIIIVVVQAVVFYINLFYLLPFLLEKKKYLFYIVSLVVLIILFVLLFDRILHYFMLDDGRPFSGGGRRSGIPDEFRDRPFRGGKRYFKRMGGPFMVYGRFIMNAFFVFIALFISTIYYNTIINRRRERESFQLKNQVLEAETKMLKWQINPHFLFNTLNNIYSMAQLKSDKTPDAVHRLSEMLRYVIYDCNEKFVKLEQEIKYIKSYIELQLLKDDEMQNVTYDFQKVNPNLKIAPMLLISFIENSFKHSKFESAKNSWINMVLSTDKKQLKFKIENSIPDISFTKDQTGGIGLENVGRRLKLLYPEKHYLNLSQYDEVYSVELILELNEN